ncbi:hypothetical protein INS49_011722 [Diaporthe citri]|uniref:uncharacterized protein n=1 Tax=Diaporthe citri TaxID=83186 RepID=UPI001C81D267|nr:uncharacterized protein INS49_011722 [Diaporthe citri]KAG6360657.1 hypothetical protein INS49_011722 [Diaporthe citri]
MSDNGDNKTPRALPKSGGPKKGGTKDGITKDSGPKTPTSAEKGRKNMTQIELTPIESLLFFNMVRFNGNHDKIDWNLVASHSNLKNAASAKVRFRQILKKHDLMDQAPETPRSQAQKRKAAPKSDGLDDDEDGESSYNPSPVAAKASVRKRSARAGCGRGKRQKLGVKSEDEQDDEEAIADSIVGSPASAPKTDPETEIKDSKTESSEPGSKIMPLPNDDGVAGGIDGTDSASPQEYSRSQAPQGFSAGGAHLGVPGYHQTALPSNMGEAQMMQLQLRQPGMFPNSIDGNRSFAFPQPLNPNQLAALQAPRTPQMQPQQMTAEQRQRHQLMLEAQAQQFNRFEFMQMSPYHMRGIDMPGGNVPFGHMTQMQFSEQYPADIYNGGGTFFDQAHLGHDVDGQDEWDVESAEVKRKVTPEAKEEDEHEEGDEFNHEHEGKLKLEEI